MKPIDRLISGLPTIPAAVGEPQRWPTATSVQLARKVYRTIFLIAAGCSGVALLLAGPSLVAVPPVAIASICLAGWAAAIAFIQGYEGGVQDAIDDTKRLAERAAVLPGQIERELWEDFLPPQEGQGYLYVLEFETGSIKVGQTTDAARRVYEHCRDAWAYNVVMTNVWISKPHEGYLTNEVALIAAVSEFGGERAKREYFHDADFDKCVQLAESLVSPAPVPAG